MTIRPWALSGDPLQPSRAEGDSFTGNVALTGGKTQGPSPLSGT